MREFDSFLASASSLFQPEALLRFSSAARARAQAQAAVFLRLPSDRHLLRPIGQPPTFARGAGSCASACAIEHCFFSTGPSKEAARNEGYAAHELTSPHAEKPTRTAAVLECL